MIYMKNILLLKNFIIKKIKAPKCKFLKKLFIFIKSLEFAKVK